MRLLELSLVMAAAMEDPQEILVAVVLAVIMVMAAMNLRLVTVAVAVVVVHIALLTVVLVVGEQDHLVKGHLVLMFHMPVELVALVAKMV